MIWLLFRKRTLKEECTHYEYDFRFWRNMIVGAIMVIGLIYCIDLYYIYKQEAEFEALKRLIRGR